VITTIIISLVTGILLGFATSARTPTDGIEDLTRNIVVGIAGAYVGLQVIGRILNSAETGTSTVTLAIAAISGAAILLFVVKRFRRT
jgi:uncharacterized membrane protein YeaQ/YmgE (transglycosylase-associated protein family)